MHVGIYLIATDSDRIENKFGQNSKYMLNCVDS